MTTSIDVAAAGNMTAAQYNALRDDVLDEATNGHTHSATGNNAPKVAPGDLSPQGAGSGIDAQKLDGRLKTAYAQFLSGKNKALPAASTAGRFYQPTDLKGLFLLDSGSEWLYIGNDPLRVSGIQLSLLNHMESDVGQA